MAPGIEDDVVKWIASIPPARVQVTISGTPERKWLRARHTSVILHHPIRGTATGRLGRPLPDPHLSVTYGSPYQPRSQGCPVHGRHDTRASVFVSLGKGSRSRLLARRGYPTHSRATADIRGHCPINCMFRRTSHKARVSYLLHHCREVPQ